MLLLVLGKQFKTTMNLIEYTQENLHLWDGLLEATSGMLNPPKSIWAHFTRITSKHGNLILQPGELTLPDPDNTPDTITLSW